ncbi:hypothetical protein CAP35_01850 [Chitinophagaceae bacterium IBVUCB1]|nr:hypothetical protein CAP35_01850 [Chitinophagaceae bacterium IBVUCB1]
MIQKVLLPHRYKKAGVWFAPIGFITWCAAQQGAFSGWIETGSWQMVTILATSFFGFLAGLYFLIFAKEKNEDEYIAKLRLQSFQTAAFGQLAFFILSFVYIALSVNEPAGDAQLELFLILAILLFWVFYIAYFNITMYRIRKMAHEK